MTSPMRDEGMSRLPKNLLRHRRRGSEDDHQRPQLLPLLEEVHLLPQNPG